MGCSNWPINKPISICVWVITVVRAALCSDIDCEFDCNGINAGSANNTATPVSFLSKLSHLINIIYNRIYFQFYKY